jgi:hypothetical protein
MAQNNDDVDLIARIFWITMWLMRMLPHARDCRMDKWKYLCS